MREREVEQYLYQKVSLFLHTKCVKFIPDGMTGMPDRLILLPDGRVVWVELKTEGGRLSEIQKYRHEELRRMGQQVETVWNKQQVDELVERLLEQGVLRSR